MWSDLTTRLRSLFRRRAVERELDDELRFHFDQHIAKLIARGTPRDEATRQARLRFGASDTIKEECRDARGMRWIDSRSQDIRYALRVLAKSPGFAAVAILTLALGIGANTAIFSVVDSMLLRPLPYPDSSRLVTIDGNESMPDLDDIRAQSQSFDVVGSRSMQRLDYTGGPQPIQIFAIAGDAGMYQVLGARPELGRMIGAEDDVFGAAPVVVLSHAFWMSQFGGDPSAIGKQITLSGASYTIVGVMTPDFWLPHHPADVFSTLRIVYPIEAKERGVHILTAFLHLKHGVTLARAQAEMVAIDASLAQAHPDHDGSVHRKLVPLLESVVGDTRSVILIFLGAVSMVLLIACVNFANLLLARAASRQRELAIRSALGAGSSRLVAQLLTESVVLSLAGGVAGIALAYTGLRGLLALAPEDLPRLSTISIDGRVLAFTIALSILTGIVFGMVPAYAATRSSACDSLKDCVRSIAGSRASLRLRRLLVVSETALALILLVGAGLLIRSFALMASVPPGFRTDHILTLNLSLPAARYKKLPAQNRFRTQLLDSLNAMPSVQAAMISELPLGGDQIDHDLAIEGRPVIPGKVPTAQTRTVLGDYFRVMDIPLHAGREFSVQDQTGSPEVVVVNDAFVRRFLPDQNPLGAHIGWALDNPIKWKTIVGVVGDVKHFGLDQPDAAAVYGLYTQSDEDWKRWMSLTIRSPREPSSLARDVEQKIWAIDSALPPSEVLTMKAVVSGSLSPQRFNFVLLGIFAVVALVLAAIGIYGVIAYSVTQRTHEIGVRVAVGAQPHDIVELVLGESGRLVAAGTLFGLVGAVALTRFMSTMLFGVTPRDPLTFVAVAVGLAAVAFLASYIPARRALRVDPMIALRHE
ncbi:MAG: ABC transporter permease [Candidatus Acidiferrales bacterium]